MRWFDLPPRSTLGPTGLALSLALLLTPTAVLGALAVRHEALPIAAGAGVQLLFALVFLRAHPVWRPPVSGSVILLYLIALAWAYVPTRGHTDWVVHVAQGVLLAGAVGLVALHDLTRTGAEPLRRANKWSRRIACRTHWPLQLADARLLPEVDALRDAVRDEPGPALALLSDPRPEVKVAALGSLEYRPDWRPGEAELVLKVAREAHDPAVRQAAAYALAGVKTPALVEDLAGFLRDPAAEVRHAAAEAVLWDGDRRWPLARTPVREALSDPKLAADGPLFVGSAGLPAAAVADLMAWADERPPLGARSVLTLVEQYHRGMADGGRPELASELAQLMLASETPTGLRVELAGLLRDHHRLTPDLLDRMTNMDQPAPMRLFAAEVMLRADPNDADGIDVLRGLARQPNRELAVQIGGILQNVLGLDLGLVVGGPLPAPASKAGAEVARKVLGWANGQRPDGQRPTPPSRPGLAGLRETNFVPPASAERPRVF
ncbi:MAG: HEAT repeat domain-containing protein [Gemmataceae bacterium]